MQKSQPTKSSKPTHKNNISKLRLRQIFEESFKQFGPFERNEGMGKPYKDETQSMLYINFSNALNRIQQLEAEPKVQVTESEGQFIVLREDAKKGYVAPNGLAPQKHFAKACADAISLANRGGQPVSVFVSARTYQPKKETVKAAPKLPTVNPLTVINRLYAHFASVPEAERPADSPAAIVHTTTGSSVSLHNGQVLTFDTPNKGFEYVDQYLNEAAAKQKAEKVAAVNDQIPDPVAKPDAGRDFPNPGNYNHTPTTPIVAPSSAAECEAAAL